MVIRISKLIFLLPLLFLQLFTTACSEEALPELYFPESQEGSIIVSPAGEAVTLEFHAGTEWTVTSSTSWATPTEAAGEAGEQRVLIECQPNQTIHSRTASVTVRTLTQSRTIVFTQAEDPGAYGGGTIEDFYEQDEKW